MPAFSVIISVFNGEKYLSECLDSVLGQTFNDAEIICINDGSSDNSLAILRQYAADHENIKVIDQENQGLACSRNNAMKLAKGKYLIFLDCDDYWSEDTLEVLYKHAEKYSLDMLSFAGVNFDDDTKEYLNSNYYQFKYLPKNFRTQCFSCLECQNFLTKMAVSSCLTIYNRDFITKHNIEFPAHLFFEDNIFFTHAILTAKRVGICKKTLYFRRIHSESITQNWSKHFTDYKQICSKVIDLVKTLPVSPEIKKQYAKAYIANLENIYNRIKGKFNRDEQRQYTKAIDMFKAQYGKIGITKKSKYTLFSFIPLFSIEED